MKAIILMGGKGERFGSETPKQFLNLSGKKVYLHTLEAFLQFECFEKIILVCHPDWIVSIKEEVKDPRIHIIKGGLTRQNSTYLGLLACGKETDFVMIHDAVRPFVSREIIQSNIDALKKHEAVDTCIPSADTIVHAKRLDTIDSIPNRREYLRGQTPQSFSYPLILEAHEKATGKDASDDCSLILNLGRLIHIVPGSPDNIKITSELDLFLAEQLIHLRRQSIAPSSKSLKGKVFAITGGTGGIGSALAKQLKLEGASPLILSTSAQEYPVDLTNSLKVESTFKAIATAYGPLDGLINCVGFLSLKPFKELTPEEMDQLIQTNLHALLYSCRYALLKKGAHIINLSSSAFTRGRKNYSLYSAAKAAIVNFTQGLAEEHPELQVNVAVPQRTNTPMRRNNFTEEDPATLLSPEEVAEQLLLLLKNEQTTGTILEIRKK